MESERRHELETNSLAIWLYRLPDLLRKHANKLLLGAVLLALLVFAIQYRNRSVAQRQMQVREGLSTAWSGVRQLPALALRDMDGEQFVNLRDSIEREALNGIDDVFWPARCWPRVSFTGSWLACPRHPARPPVPHCSLVADPPRRISSSRKTPTSGSSRSSVTSTTRR
jgi:hypothetical protein